MLEGIKQALVNSNIVKHYAQISTSPFLIAMAIIDVLLIIGLIYYLFKRTKKERGAILVKGVLLLIVLTVVTGWLQLYLMNKILTSIVRYGYLALIIIFQPELRKALERIGNTKIAKSLGVKKSDTEIQQIKDNIYKVVRATEELAKTKTGALIVFERDFSLEEIAKSGVSIKAEISVQILGNIFIVNTPLHDGAVLIRNGKIDVASAILPLTDDITVNQSFGTRHRAALGVSTQTDAVAVVVSEETGKRSIAVNGELQVGLNNEQMKDALMKYLLFEE